MYKEKKVLVAGGTGTIGIPLVKKLIAEGSIVRVVSMDTPELAKKLLGDDVEFLQKDLTSMENCLDMTRGMDYVFNLVGIKGSTGIGEKKVASYLVPMLLFQTNLMEASFQNKVSRYLFTSSICVYPQSDKPKEEGTMWDGMPKQNDRIPGIAKRVGEIQGESYMLEYGWDAVRIVRPSNVYGPYDDFNPATAQVIPALIGRIMSGEDPLTVWGDGSAVRDFIYSDDIAHWMMVALESAPPIIPINIGNGEGIRIKEIVDILTHCVPNPPKVEWDTTKPTGDSIRILSTKKAEELIDFHPITTIEDGIKKTLDWYNDNEDMIDFIKKQRNGK